MRTQFVSAIGMRAPKRKATGSSVFKKFGMFRRNQDGNASIEFVFLFPIFMFLFMVGFEAGFYMVRNVMLERAVDIAVRDVRLGNTGNTPGQPPEFAALKKRICDEAVVFPDCMKSVQVEMRPIAIAAGAIGTMNTATRCADKDASDNDLNTVYDSGEANSLMVIRVCALSQPIFPSTGIGAGMKRDNRGNMALITTTAFVNEPGNRARVTNDNKGIGAGGA